MLLKMMRKKIFLPLYICALSLSLLSTVVSCSGVSVPEVYKESAQLPKIYPDYVDVMVPVNIAPLSFMLDGDCDEMVARYTYAGDELLAGGESACPDVGEWHQLTQHAQGQDIQVEVYARRQGEWTRYKPFAIKVSPDSIDPYISYRLISPSYVAYEELTISQHSLERHEESVIYDNMLCSTAKEGQCVNCHHFQQYDPARMQFHARQNMGGTVIAYDGSLRKVNMANDSILSAGVYPAWHPWLPLIVYSTNITRQVFHTRDINKIEVFDSASDLIAYDAERNEVANLERAADELEVFPAWAPTGDCLYYCSAHFEFRDTTDHELQVIERAREVKYNLYRKRFNPETWEFGPSELLFDAATMGKSATLPRVSPDGRYLMFTLGEAGCFHIWHYDADLWTIDLQTGEARALRELNSDKTESYHSWSSNGRWVVFSSRRDDGGFTRPFFAHIDAKGRGSKPFELPEADPAWHRKSLKCYNIPEFVKGKVEVRPQQWADVLKTEGTLVKYVRALRAGQ